MSVDDMDLQNPDVFWLFVGFVYEQSSGYIPDY